MPLKKEYDPTIRGGFLVRPTDDLTRDFFLPFLFNPRPVETQDQANYSQHKIPGKADPMIQYLQGEAQIINIQVIVEQLRIDEFKAALTRVRQIRKKARGNPADSGTSAPSAVTVGGEQFGLPSIEEQAQRRNQSNRLRTRGGSVTAARQLDDQAFFSFRQPQMLIQTSAAGGSFMPDTAREYVELIKSLSYPRENTKTFIKKSPPKVTFVWGSILINCRVTRVRVTEEEHYGELDLEHAVMDITLMRDDPLAPRIFKARTKSGIEIETALPTGINQQDIRAAGAIRPSRPAGYWFL